MRLKDAIRCLGFSLLLSLLQSLVTYAFADDLSPANAAEAPEGTYVLWNRNFDTAPVNKIIELALAKTPAAGSYRVVRSKPLEQNEALADLSENATLDILSVAASATEYANLIAINLPVLGGLLGDRLCLIRAGTQSVFNSIVTAHDFVAQQIKVCQGASWPDTPVLKRNGFDVRTAPVYEDLFTMLAAGDCDCFLRGAQEILPEHEAHQPSLVIEQRLLVRYRQPGILYVHESQPALAARLELGLLRALDDGSYDALLDTLLGEAMHTLRRDDRHIIRLNNPFLSKEVARLESIDALWF